MEEVMAALRKIQNDLDEQKTTITKNADEITEKKNERSYSHLENNLIDFLEKYFSLNINCHDLEAARRIGKNRQARPIAVTFATLEKEDASGTSQNRAGKGNKAIIKYDKLVVLKHNKTDADHTDNRKANKHNKELNKNEFLHLPSRPVTEEDYDQNLPTILLKTNSSTKENNLINQLYKTTYNVRTLSSQERLIELTEALKNVKNDIIGLCEVRRLGSKITEYENFIFCHTGESPGKYQKENAVEGDPSHAGKKILKK
ncbi:hypothetical protein EVAR_7814_1 [Eumeta japonica]|uniref:Uncharacterized protein n=1 Tax=Eumeta variegata TaxID=151549 RepID=A0A4C1TMD7_EUMVA|nr:hypothetical protein EVAR_7814_1 [Eumeta japonica]